MEFVDVRFCDLPGTMQHFTVPTESFDQKVFTDGLMFDGSSIRGFQQIHESDMLLLPHPATAVHSQRNRSACVRIPVTGANPKAKRLEFRVPDPSANPYLARSPR